MARLTKTLTGKLFGTTDARAEGLRRTLTGVRTGDQRELFLGLALSALAYLDRTRPRRRLLFRENVPVGSAVVVYHKKRGEPRIEIIKP